MWEEDPRWQQASYRFLLWSVGIIGVVAALTSAFTHDWIFVRSYVICLAVVLAALGVYAGVVWTAAQIVVLLVRLYRRVFHGDRNG